MDTIDNWATGQMKEFPFWKDGMSPEEFDEERLYFLTHFEDYTKGNYTPLWKQHKK